MIRAGSLRAGARRAGLRRSDLLVLVAVLSWPAGVLSTHPTPLPDSRPTTPSGYVVEYTNDNPYAPPAGAGDDRNYFPDALAQNLSDALDNGGPSTPGNPNGHHSAFIGLGFLAPPFAGGDRDMEVYDTNVHFSCDSGCAPADLIAVPAPTHITSGEPCLRVVAGHELFHEFQYAYITFGNWSGWGAMPVEGTARMMQDKIYSDIDANAGCFTYRGQSNNYLGNPNRTVWNISYTSALFWNYLTEQFGSGTAEPAIGTDFIRTFWENAQPIASSPDVVGTVRQTIHDFDVSATLENAFHDFTIANYAKDEDVSLLADAIKYRYVDENDGASGSYNPVVRTWSGPIPPQRGPIAESVVRWGAKYYEANLVDCSGVVGFLGDGDRAAYSLLAISGTDRVERVFKSVTDHFARSLIIPVSSPYTRLVAVVAGLDDAASYDYTFACGQASLQILRPDGPDGAETQQAWVGDPAAPDPFLARLLVTGPAVLGTPSVEGLDPSDFTAFVGPELAANEATILSGARVQGEYWLVIQPPTKPATGTFDLLVKLGPSVTATELQAVRYEPLVLDQVVVIDRSGSMLSPAASPKIDAAINAGRLFVDAASSDDRIGAVSFGGDDIEPNDDATLEELMLLATDGHRANVKTAIGGISIPSAGVLTSIGDGLEKARNEFVARGSLEGDDWIVLLSDGMENEGAFWSDVSSAITSAGIKVEAIALGPNTDQALMQAIASATGGSYYYVDVGTVASLAAPLAPSPGAPLPNRLADVFASVSERIGRRDRLWEVEGTVAAPSTDVHPVPIGEGGVTDGVFAVNWADPANKADVEIFRPGGILVVDGVGGARIFGDSTHVVAQVGDLTPGTWEVHVADAAGSPSYIASLSGKAGKSARMEVYLGQFHGDPLVTGQGGTFARGLPMPILVTLTDPDGPVRGAEVFAEVEHPDGQILALRLLDDGSHEDGNADDGIYGNAYTRTTEASPTGLADDPAVPPVRGSYNVNVAAAGLDNFGQDFSRIRKLSFQIFEIIDPSPDTDQDEMPDRYEDLHDCLDPLKSDGAGDPDNDGLQSVDEWKLGTDPCHPDTDRGGEADRSELNGGRNPFDPLDDVVPRPTDVEVPLLRPDHGPDYPCGPGTNVVRYPVHSSYDRIRLWRSTSPSGPFALAAEFGAASFGGIFPDKGLVDGLPYFYFVEAIDLAGNQTAPSHVFSGTPRPDCQAPKGAVVVDGGAAHTESTLVPLELVAYDADVSEMQVSNDPSFTGVPWTPYTPALAAWLLAPDPGTGQAIVYARFRDPSLNESEIYHDEIFVRPPGSLGKLVVTALLEGQASHGDILVLADRLPPAYTDPLGEATVPVMGGSFFDVFVDLTGYVPVTVPQVFVPAGGEAQVGPVTLLADLDEDQAPNGSDSCPTVPNVGDADADGVDDACDTCLGLFNPAVANATVIDPAFPLGWMTLVSGQRDDDADGAGNACDADFDQAGAVVGGTDLGLQRGAFNQSVAGNTCGGPCDVFDMDEVGALIGGSDLSAGRARFNTQPGPACDGPDPDGDTIAEPCDPNPGAPSGTGTPGFFSTPASLTVGRAVCEGTACP